MRRITIYAVLAFILPVTCKAPHTEVFAEVRIEVTEPQKLELEQEIMRVDSLHQAAKQLKGR